MPESFTLTTTLELPVVKSHPCGADTFCNHHSCGNSTSFGVTAKRFRFSRCSKVVVMLHSFQVTREFWGSRDVTAAGRLPVAGVEQHRERRLAFAECVRHDQIGPPVAI